ncbi:MFS transporter [Ramlibacter sp.]|uniref:MFS transporter n=1 Tax=Ramlibacter sp. TaxID=1917967 RepID=UPI003D0F3938
MPKDLTASRLRIVPLLVACPIFLQNLDSSALGTALPAIAASLHADVLDLNLAITCYLIGLVVFLPASAWMADRFGPRRVFCASLAIFTAASLLCAMAVSLPQLVAFRLLQGAGGSMMLPVGRLILLQAVPPAQLMLAMVWFSVPGGVGRLVGPLMGGAIVTVASWRWIFLVSVPLGIATLLLAWRFIDRDPPPPAELPAAPDAVGLLMLALSLGALLAAVEVIGKGVLPWPSIAALAAGGVALLWLYLRRSRGQAEPMIDFSILRVKTYWLSVGGGTPARMAAGSFPFLLPLLLQLGFGIPALQTGLLMLASAFGALCARPLVVATVKRWGERTLLVFGAACASALFGVYGLFTAETPWWIIAGVLVLASAANTSVLVVLATIGYQDLPPRRMGHGAALSTMVQQLTVALGVVLAAALLDWMHQVHGGAAGRLAPEDFRLALAATAMLPVISLLAFLRLPKTGPI